MPSRYPHLYRTPRWRKERAEHLRAHPFCVPCSRAKRRTKATIVHHKTPHRGNETLFWDRTKWEGRCRTCHDDAEGPEKTGRRETYRGCDESGVPLDPRHPWNDPKGSK